MARLVIEDRRKDWEGCQVCHHLVNPRTRACDETWGHLPCTSGGCVVPVASPIELAHKGEGDHR